MQNVLGRKASEVRKNWSTTMDSVVHERPIFISGAHDSVAMLDERLLALVLQEYRFHLTEEREEDGTVTGYIDELGLVENAPTKEACITQMISAMRDYALDYYREFAFWSKAPNRASHIPYILKILVSTDEEIKGSISCQDGKN